MMLNPAKRVLLVTGMTALTLCAAWPGIGAQEASVEGVFALPGVARGVSGRMDVRETGPLSRELDVVYADRATGEQVLGFDVELTQQLHILATDAELTTLIHRHVEEASKAGKFSAELEFPKAGLYHIYTDAVPTGYGQQVLRFDVTVGESGGTHDAHGQPASQPAKTGDGPITSSDRDYTVLLDASQLRAGKESVLNLSVQKNGEPADDLAPYLGVAAHVVFVRKEDLAYVHAHAVSSSDQHGHAGHDNAAGTGAEPEPANHSTGHDAHATTSDAPAAGHNMGMHHDDAGAQLDMTHEGSASDHMADHGAPAAAAGSVSPEMSLYVTPPASGVYALWIEFIGGGEVLTVPFSIEIP